MNLTKIISSLFILLLLSFVARADIVVSGGGNSDIYGPLPGTPGAANNTPPPPPPPPAQAPTPSQSDSSNSGSGIPSISSQNFSPAGGGGGGAASDSTGTSSTSNLLVDNPYAKTVLLTPPLTDVSMGYLRVIFGTVDGVLAGAGSQMLGKMFGTFNAVILSLGGIILMYIIIVSTLSTAHEGEIMGKKWSSIWIPLRAALGVGFLVPKASGYSLIQIMMMWIVTQGIGAADSVWNQTLNYLSSGGVIVNVQQGKNIPNSDAVLSTASDTLRSLVCMYTVQKALNDYQRANPTQPRVPALYATIKPDLAKRVIKIPGDIPGYDGYSGVCGVLEWPPYSATPEIFSDASMQIVSDLADTAQQLVTMATTPIPANSGTPQYPPPTGMIYAVLDYNSLMIPAMISSEHISPTLLNYEAVQSMKKDGWIMAGTYYSVITKNSTTILRAVTPPKVMRPPSTLKALQDINKNLFSSDSLNAGMLSNATIAAENYIISAKAAYTSMNQAKNAAPQFPPFSGLAFRVLGLDTISLAFGDLRAAVAPIDEALTTMLSSSLNDLFRAMLSTFGSGNPIDVIVSFGNKLIIGAFQLWAVAATASIGLSVISAIIPIWGAAFVAVIQTISTWMMPFIGALVGMGLLAGIMASFYIPLIPFVLFTFGAIGWLVGVIETIIAAPLVAIGLMSPEGDEAFGKASPAIMLITSVFLRPTLMLFGYIAGIIMSYVGLWLLTRGFAYAAISVLSMGFEAGVSNAAAAIGFSAPDYAKAVTVLSAPSIALEKVVVFLAFLLTSIVLYCILASIIVQKAFELISVVPDSVLRWIGGTDKGPGAHYAEGMGEKAQGKAEGAAKEASQLLGSHSPNMSAAKEKPAKSPQDTGSTGGDTPAPT